MPYQVLVGVDDFIEWRQARWRLLLCKQQVVVISAAALVIGILDFFSSVRFHVYALNVLIRRFVSGDEVEMVHVKSKQGDEHEDAVDDKYHCHNDIPIGVFESKIPLFFHIAIDFGQVRNQEHRRHRDNKGVQNDD